MVDLIENEKHVIEKSDCDLSKDLVKRLAGKSVDNNEIMDNNIGTSTKIVKKIKSQMPQI